MESYLRQVIYLRQDFWIAHFLLARLLKERGDAKRARNEFQLTRKLLGNVKEDSRFFVIFPLACGRKDVDFLCSRELVAMDRAKE